MHSIIPATKGILAIEGSDSAKREIAQKNAGLRIQYSALFIGRSCGTELLDNGGLAVIPASETVVPRNTAGQVQGERTKGVVS